MDSACGGGDAGGGNVEDVAVGGEYARRGHGEGMRA